MIPLRRNVRATVPGWAGILQGQYSEIALSITSNLFVRATYEARTPFGKIRRALTIVCAESVRIERNA